MSRPMHWRNLAGTGAIGREVVAVRFENGMRSPDARGSSGWAWATAVPPSRKKHNPFLQSLVRILVIERAHCVTPRLIRIHAVLAACEGDGTLMSMHMRP